LAAVTLREMFEKKEKHTSNELLRAKFYFDGVATCISNLAQDEEFPNVLFYAKKAKEMLPSPLSKREFLWFQEKKMLDRMVFIGARLKEIMVKKIFDVVWVNFRLFLIGMSDFGSVLGMFCLHDLGYHMFHLIFFLCAHEPDLMVLDEMRST